MSEQSFLISSSPDRPLDFSVDATETTFACSASSTPVKPKDGWEDGKKPGGGSEPSEAEMGVKYAEESSAASSSQGDERSISTDLAELSEKAASLPSEPEEPARGWRCTLL